MRNRTVLFGGWTDNGRINDTWEYDGTDWTQVAAANPPAPRWAHSMAYDPALGRTVLFGGDYLIPGRLGPNNETWLYDGAAWQQLVPTNSPSPRDWAPIAYDSAQASLVLFGGTDEGYPQHALGDTWALAVPGPSATLSASSIDFVQQPVLSASSKTVTLTNTGGAPLVVTAVTAGGDFSAGDKCPRAPGSVAPGGACSITVTFVPSTGNGPITGSLTLTDNAGSGTQSIPLSGSGQWGELNPLAVAIDFGSTLINPTGPTATGVETITIPDFPTILSAVSADAPYLVTNADCPMGVVLPVGTTCHVQLAFEPTVPGTYNGRLVLRSNEPNLRVIALTGTALPPPASLDVAVGPIGAQAPTFGHSIRVVATTNATSGSATFSLNGQQIGASQPINSSGASTQTIQLDDSTIPAGAGTYPLVVSVHPTDGLRADNSVTQSINVVQAPQVLSWNGTGLAVAGATANLSVTVAPPPGETQFNFTSHQAWVRFDVTDGSGTVRTYDAQVLLQSGVAAASVRSGPLAAGTFSVRARLVASAGTDAPNAYVSSEDMRSAFAARPAKGGFLAGSEQESALSIAFELVPGSTPSGSLLWVQATQVVGSDGQWHDAYLIIASTSVTTLSPHSHTVSATGNATVRIVDAITGAHYSAFDSTTTFQLNVNADGSGTLAAAGTAADFPAGSVVNHL